MESSTFGECWGGLHIRHLIDFKQPPGVLCSGTVDFSLDGTSVLPLLLLLRVLLLLLFVPQTLLPCSSAASATSSTTHLLLLLLLLTLEVKWVLCLHPVGPCKMKAAIELSCKV
jgi:hypothetical protein